MFGGSVKQPEIVDLVPLHVKVGQLALENYFLEHVLIKGGTERNSMMGKVHELPIFRQAKLLKISRGTAYYLPKPVSPVDLALMWHIDELHLGHPFMDTRMLRDQLGLLGLHVGRRHVRTLVRRMNIQTIAPQPSTSKAKPGNKIYPYLLRHLPIIKANQVWALDTSYIAMAKGFV